MSYIDTSATDITLSDLGGTPAGGNGGQAQPNGPTVTDVDFYARRMRILQTAAPQLTGEPDVLAQIATSPVPDELMARQAASYTGMYTADQLARQITTLSAPEQRVIWSTLTQNQQNSLAAMGYNPPQRERAKASGILGAIGGISGAAFSGFHRALSTVLEPTFEVVKDIGEVPSELYRTVRQLPPEMQALALIGAAAGGVGLAALAPAAIAAAGLGSAGLAVGAGGATTAAFGALGGYAATGLVAATVMTPGTNEFIDAWHLANSGETVFTTESKRKASALLGNDDGTLLGLARDIGFDENYDVAAAFAGVRGSDDPRRMQARIAEIALRAGEAGTPEFNEAASLLERVTNAPSFVAAVRTLEAGKISFGRDVARTVGFTYGSRPYDLVSGGLDAAFMLGLDPLIVGTKALKIGRALRFGVNTGVETGPYAQRIRDIAMADTGAGKSVRRAFEVMADGMNTNRWDQTMSLLPSTKRLRGGLGTYGTQHHITEWTPDHIRNYFEEQVGMMDMLMGRGASWKRGALEVPHISRYGLKLRQAKTWMAKEINFADDLNIEHNQLGVIDRLKAKDPRLSIDKVRPGAADPQAYTPEAVLPTYATEAGIEFAGGRLAGLAESPGHTVRIIANIPVLGSATRQFSTIAKTLAQHVPVKRYIPLSDSGAAGAGRVEELQKFTEMFRAIGVPRAVRTAWFNTITDTRNLASRQLAVRAATKTMLDYAGMSATDEGIELIDTFTRKLDQRFLEVTSDIELAPGLVTKHSTFPGADDAVFIAIPTFQDLRMALGKDTMLHRMLNAADGRFIEASMARIWKPAVLLRLGFIPRAAGDEMLAFLAQHGMSAYVRSFVERAAAQDDDELLAHANIIQSRFVDPISSLIGRSTYGRKDGMDDIGASILLGYSRWMRDGLRAGFRPDSGFGRTLFDKVLAPQNTIRGALFRGVSRQEMRWARDFAMANPAGTINGMAAGQSGMAASTVNDLTRLAQVDAKGHPLDEVAIRMKRDVYSDHARNSPQYRSGIVRRTAQAVDNIAFNPGSPVLDEVVARGLSGSVGRYLGPDADGIVRNLVSQANDASPVIRDMVALAGMGRIDSVMHRIENLEPDHWFHKLNLSVKPRETANQWLTRISKMQAGGDAKLVAVKKLAKEILNYGEDLPTRRYLSYLAGNPEAWSGRTVDEASDLRTALIERDMEQMSDPEWAAAWDSNMAMVVGRGSIPVIDPPADGMARFYAPVMEGNAIADMQGELKALLETTPDDQWVDTLTGEMRRRFEAAGEVLEDDNTFRVAARVATEILGMPPRHMTAYGIEQQGEALVKLTTSAMSSAPMARNVSRVLNRFALADDVLEDVPLLSYIDVTSGAGRKAKSRFDDTIGDDVINYTDRVWGRRISPSHEAIPVPEQHIEMMDAAGNPAYSIETALRSRASTHVDETLSRLQRGYHARLAADAERQADQFVRMGAPSGEGPLERAVELDDSITGAGEELYGSDLFVDDLFDSAGIQATTDMGGRRIVKRPPGGDRPIGIMDDGEIAVDWQMVEHDHADAAGYLRGKGTIDSPGDAADVKGADVPDPLSTQAAKALTYFNVTPAQVLEYVDTPARYATFLANYVNLAAVSHNPRHAMGLALSGAGFPLPSKAERYLQRMAARGTEDELMWEVLGPALYDKHLYDTKRPVVERSTRRYGVLNVNDHPESRVVKTLDESHVNDLASEDLPPVVTLPEEHIRKLTGWDAMVEKGFRKVIGPAIDVIARKPIAFHNYMVARKDAAGILQQFLPGEIFGNLYTPVTRVNRLNAGRKADPDEVIFIRHQLTDIRQGMSPEARWARENLGTSHLFEADGRPSGWLEANWDEVNAKLDAAGPDGEHLKYLLDRYTNDPIEFGAAPEGSFRKILSRIRTTPSRTEPLSKGEKILLTRMFDQVGFINPGQKWQDGMRAYFDDVSAHNFNLDAVAQRLGVEEQWAAMKPKLPAGHQFGAVTEEREAAEMLLDDWTDWKPHEERYHTLLRMEPTGRLEPEALEELTELKAQRPWWLDDINEEELGVVDKAHTVMNKLRDTEHSIAQERAINDSIPFIDSDGIRSQFQEYVRNLMPFLFAEDQFIRRWARTAAIRPDTIRRAQLMMGGLRSMGLVQEDQYGNEVFVYPASATFTEAISKLPFVPDMMPVASMMTGQVKYILPGLDNYGMPSGSPLLTLPMSYVTSMFPELQPIHDKFTGDRGQRAGVVRSLVPTSVMRFYDAFMGDPDSNRKLASAMMSAMQVGEANGWAPAPDATPLEIEKYLDRVKATARTMLLAQAVFGFVVPASPQIALAGGDTPGSSGTSTSLDALTGLNFSPASLSPQYIELVHLLGIDEGTDRFLERYPDTTPDDLFNDNMAYSTRMTDTPSGANIPTHRSAWEFYEDNQDYFGSFEFAAAYLIPPGRTPEEVADRPDSVHGDQLAAGLRIRRAPDDLYGEIKWAAAAPVYFKTLEDYNALEEQGLTPDERTNEDAKWNAWRTTFLQGHPIFADRLQSGEGRVRRQRTIEELRVALRDPQAPLPWHAAAMSELLTTWDSWRAARMPLASQRSRSAMQDKEDLDAGFHRWVEDYVRRHPEVGTLWGAVLRPESGL